MHYQTSEFVIESELAAKPVSQTNKYVIEYIANLPRNLYVLDYGCGKLRYSIPLAMQVKQVIGIDSTYQVDSSKKIGECICSPRDYKMNNLAVMSIDDHDWRENVYDVVFCTNVLSAVPVESARLEIIENAKKVLKRDGYLFISVQYRNSYFSQYKTREDVVPYNDGWFIRRGRTNKGSFYAMLDAEYIISLCQRAGFDQFTVNKRDGSCFIEARN